MNQVVRIGTKGRVRSLWWEGDDLVDVVDGFRRWSLDGLEQDSRRGWGFPFDSMAVSPSGRFHVLYAERGTKAILLADGAVIRELNRSFSHATDYDYPVALGRLSDGREVVVHCPEHYNVLEVEDLASGERLTAGPRTPIDVFHSRLSVSPDGRHLLAAGWVWHPYGVVMVFDLQRALADPSALDGRGVLLLYNAIDAEVEAACWLDDDRIAAASSGEEPLNGDEPDALAPSQIGVWSLSQARWLHRASIDYRVGTMIGCGDLLIALHGHPRAVNPATGAVAAEWPGIDAGAKDASYGVTHVPTPVTALHPDRTRLAIAQPDHIAVLQLPYP